MTLAIQTDAFWNQSVDGYVASAEPFTALFCEDAVRLALIGPGMRVLDIATGPGALALAAARAGADVTAIDFSQAMIDRLTTRSGAGAIRALRMDGHVRTDVINQALAIARTLRVGDTIRLPGVVHLATASK